MIYLAKTSTRPSNQLYRLPSKCTPLYNIKTRINPLIIITKIIVIIIMIKIILRLATTKVRNPGKIEASRKITTNQTRNLQTCNCCRIKRVSRNRECLQITYTNNIYKVVITILLIIIIIIIVIY